MDQRWGLGSPHRRGQRSTAAGAAAGPLIAEPLIAETLLSN